MPDNVAAAAGEAAEQVVAAIVEQAEAAEAPASQVEVIEAEADRTVAIIEAEGAANAAVAEIQADAAVAIAQADAQQDQRLAGCEAGIAELRGAFVTMQGQLASMSELLASSIPQRSPAPEAEAEPEAIVITPDRQAESGEDARPAAAIAKVRRRLL